MVLGLASQALAASVPRAADVYGGNDADIKNVPYQIEYDLNGGFDCGGTIISNRYIITAGHCTRHVKSASDITIRAGSAKLGAGTKYSVAEYHAHPKFVITDDDQIDYDISILKLSSDLKFSDSVKAIGLASSPATAGSTGHLSGWGTTQNGDTQKLQEVDLPVISHDDCVKKNDANGIHVSDRFLCVQQPGGGKGACHGDSGGPLVINGKLAGAVSGGAKCAGASAPGTYTDIGNPEIRQFIKDITGL